MPENARVAVLMSTYNGEEYVAEQIDSILNQEGVAVTLVVRDDGSSDGTLEILDEYASSHDNILLPNELNGFHCATVGTSFMLLLRYAVDNLVDCDYFAFSDQDDIWYEWKLERSVEQLSAVDTLGLYFSKKTIVDDSLQTIGSDVINVFGDFTDYLMHNYAYGCTMMLNKEFAKYALKGWNKEMPYLHDIYLSKLAISSDASIIYDSRETMMYRQHIGNVTGVQNKRTLNLNTFLKVFKKRRHYLKRLSGDILREYGETITEEKQLLVRSVANYYQPKAATRLVRYVIHSDRSIQDKAYMVLMIMTHGI